MVIEDEGFFEDEGFLQIQNKQAKHRKWRSLCNHTVVYFIVYIIYVTIWQLCNTLIRSEVKYLCINDFSVIFMMIIIVQ